MSLGAAIFLAAIVAMCLLDRVPFHAYLHTDARRAARREQALARYLADAELEPPVPLRGQLTRPGRELERR